MPVKPQLRLDLLTWIASTLPAGRELDETEINAHLRAIDDDRKGRARFNRGYAKPLPVVLQTFGVNPQ